MVLYENYLICIFMNINENLKNAEETIGLIGTSRGSLTYIEPLGAFLIDTISGDLNAKICTSEIYPFLLCDIAWFRWQPIMGF